MSFKIKIVEHFREMKDFVGISRVLPAYREINLPLQDSITSYDPSSNPVLRHLRTEFFIAYREGGPVGRIAAIKDFLNPDAGTGFFGCFECEDDPEAASALIETARLWLADNGCGRMIGPATFNTNQQVGILIEGHEQGPQIMLPFNPPYYQKLMEDSGLAKQTDLLTFSWYKEMGLPPSVAKMAERTRSDKSVHLRRFNLTDIASEARLVRDMFNQSMAANWGFIPMTTEESVGMLSFCQAFADRDLMLSVWVEREPAGILLFLPTAFPGRTRPRSVRAAILGVIPRHRHRGLDSYLIEHSINVMLDKGYEQADISLVHEDNSVMLKKINQIVGSSQTRRYRVYTST